MAIQNHINAKGEPIDSKGNKIVDLRKTNEYFVTAAHPYVKDLGVGKAINVSKHTHGPDQLAKGWLSETPPDGSAPKAPKAAKEK